MQLLNVASVHTAKKKRKEEEKFCTKQNTEGASEKGADLIFFFRFSASVTGWKEHVKSDDNLVIDQFFSNVFWHSNQINNWYIVYIGSYFNLLELVFTLYSSKVKKI